MKSGLSFWLLGILLTYSCTTANSKLPEWLVGTWSNETKRGIIFESWRSVNNELVGISYSLNNGDTTVYETIRIIEEGDEVFYIPTVKAQNNEQAVRFLAKRISSEKLVFENPSHEFPQVITYQRISADSLVAEISGVINEQQREQRFPMKRVGF